MSPLPELVHPHLVSEVVTRAVPPASLKLLHRNGRRGSETHDHI